VEDGGEADRPAEPFQAQAQKRLRGRLEEQRVELPRRGRAQGQQRVRERAHDVEIRRVQQVGLLPGEPCAREPALAAGTMPVAAAAGDVLLMSAVLARVDGIAQFARAAANQGMDGVRMALGHSGQTGAQDRAQFAAHLGRAAIRSSGAWRRWMRPCVTCR